MFRISNSTNSINSSNTTNTANYLINNTDIFFELYKTISKYVQCVIV